MHDTIDVTIEKSEKMETEKVFLKDQVNILNNNVQNDQHIIDSLSNQIQELEDRNHSLSVRLQNSDLELRRW